jgi:putative transposase
MPDYRLRVGMHFSKKGREYVVEGQLGNDRLKVRDIVTDSSAVTTVEELVEELFAGGVELIGDENTHGVLKELMNKARVTDISQLGDHDPVKEEIVRRSHYIKELVRAQPLPRSCLNVTLLVRRVSQIIGDPKPPSWVTVNRWFRAYESAGRDVRALAPSLKARGNRNPKISGKVPAEMNVEDYEKAREVSLMIDRVIRTKYLTRERPSVQSIYLTVVARISEENRHRDARDRLPIPHISSLYKVVDKLDLYESDSARYGKKYADERHRANGLGPRPSRALERVECDHTKLDLMVVDTKTRLPLGRPWLTVIIDVHTKMILGIYLGFHRPGSLSATQCLLHSIRPKAYVRTEYPFIKHDWPTYGIPELVVVDNAKEFHGSHFKDACLQLGIEPDYSPPGQAWFRGAVERWFGTLNKSLLHELPGTTFSNIFEKKDYDPQKHAVISLEVLLKIIHVWIIDIYHQRVHKGIRDIPHRRWVESVTKDPPNVPPSSNDLKVLLGFIAHRSVSRSGVELFTLLYNSAELGQIRRRLGIGEKVTIKYDPNDISMIYVWDDFNCKFLPVPALDQEYTRKLTVWQHHIIRRYARRFVQDHVDIAALSSAKGLIRKIVEGERLLERRVGGMQRIAHYLNLGQPTYETPTQPSERLTQPSEPCQLTSAEHHPDIETGVSVCTRSHSEVSSNIQYEEDSGVASDTREELAAAEEGWGANYDLPVGE